MLYTIFTDVGHNVCSITLLPFGDEQGFVNKNVEIGLLSPRNRNDDFDNFQYW